MQTISRALQRLDGDVAVGENTNVGRDIERPAHDRLCIERSIEQRAGGGKCVIATGANAHDTIFRLQHIASAGQDQ